jgi:hypothetical protein
LGYCIGAALQWRRVDPHAWQIATVAAHQSSEKDLPDN